MKEPDELYRRGIQQGMIPNLNLEQQSKLDRLGLPYDITWSVPGKERKPVVPPGVDWYPAPIAPEDEEPPVFRQSEYRTREDNKPYDIDEEPPIFSQNEDYTDLLE
jgi:hypothetical protein